MCQVEFISRNANKGKTYFDWLAENTPQRQECRVEQVIDKSSQAPRQQKCIFLLRQEHELYTKFEKLAEKS